MPEKEPKTDRPKVRVVADLMSAPPLTAEARETIAAASGRMNECKVGSIVVVDGDRAVGILTERDLVRFAASGASASEAKVSDWMTPEPGTISSTQEVAEAWQSLAEHGYRHIPVVDDERLVGIVSMRDLMRIAQIRPVEGSFGDVPRGLKGVVVAETEVGDVRGLEGFYHYRQYSAIDLCETRPLEDVWRLLFDGELPTSLSQRQTFMDEIRPLRAIPDSVKPLLPAIAKAGKTFSPLNGMRTAVSLVAAASDCRPVLDIDHQTRRADAMRIAAAIPTAAIERHLAVGVPVVRAMPNTPSIVHEGIAGLCAGAHANEQHLTLAEEALRHLGRVVRVSEPHMDAVTAVSGSGPAYFALLAEAMIEAGILLGLPREVTTQLVVQTMLGTAKQLRDEKMHPVELREMVTSPGGTTIAAIRELERAGVRAAFLNAIQAAMDRSKELARGDPQ